MDGIRHKGGDVYCPHISFWVVWGNLEGGVTFYVRALRWACVGTGRRGRIMNRPNGW